MVSDSVSFGTEGYSIQMAKWLLKAVYHVLKDDRRYVHFELRDVSRNRLSIALASSKRVALLKQVKGLRVGSYGVHGIDGTNGRLTGT